MWDAATGILLTETLKADTLIRSEKLFQSSLHSFRSLSPPPSSSSSSSSSLLFELCNQHMCVCGCLLVWLTASMVGKGNFLVPCQAEADWRSACARIALNNYYLSELLTVCGVEFHWQIKPISSQLSAFGAIYCNYSGTHFLA